MKHRHLAPRSECCALVMLVWHLWSADNQVIEVEARDQDSAVHLAQLQGFPVAFAVRPFASV